MMEGKIGDLLRDHAPTDLRMEGGGGRIYSVDPDAAARLKAMIAEQEAAQPRRRKPTGIKRASNGLDADLARRRDEVLARAAEKKAAQEAEAETQKKTGDDTMRQLKMTDEEIMAAHRRYVVEKLSLEQLTRDLPVSENTMGTYFSRLDLPIRTREGKWTIRGQARVCQLHSLTLDDVTDVVNEAEVKLKPATKKASPKADKPKIARPTPPTPSANGSGQETAVARYVAPVAVATGGDMGSQIAALQSFLATAQAQNVTVSGSVQIQLSAVIEF